MHTHRHTHTHTHTHTAQCVCTAVHTHTHIHTHTLLAALQARTNQHSLPLWRERHAQEMLSSFIAVLGNEPRARTRVADGLRHRRPAVQIACGGQSKACTSPQETHTGCMCVLGADCQHPPGLQHKRPHPQRTNKRSCAHAQCVRAYAALGADGQCPACPTRRPWLPQCMTSGRPAQP
jgi:hypothetical protein